MRYCTKCLERKPLTEFYADRRASDGAQTRCKACQGSWQKDYRRANWNAIAAKKYNTAEDVVEKLLAPGVCSICSLPCGSGKRLAIDHCHATGVVRGALCERCNLTLGRMGDSPELLRRAAEYLEKAI